MLLNNKYLNIASCHTISIIVTSFVITVITYARVHQFNAYR